MTSFSLFCDRINLINMILFMCRSELCSVNFVLILKMLQNWWISIEYNIFIFSIRFKQCTPVTQLSLIHQCESFRLVALLLLYVRLNSFLSSFTKIMNFFIFKHWEFFWVLFFFFTFFVLLKKTFRWLSCFIIFVHVFHCWLQQNSHHHLITCSHKLFFFSLAFRTKPIIQQTPKRKIKMKVKKNRFWYDKCVMMTRSSPITMKPTKKTF